MTGTPKPKICIKAKFIGPIFSLDQELSSHRQNLIFATNGTGKSFMARALRVLDDVAFDNMPDQALIPESIVSEEVVGDIGTFSLHLGSDRLGDLKFNIKSQTTAKLCPQNDIFHVFSTDFIESELRSNEYEIDGDKIKHEIIIGKENHELDSKVDEAEKVKTSKLISLAELKNNLLVEAEKLKQTFDISANLGAYKAISIDQYLSGSYVENLEPGYGEIKTQYNKYKSLPADPELPEQITIASVFLEMPIITELLNTTVSVSSVATELREKIVSSPSFFEQGLHLHAKDEEHCPFCTQNLKEVALKTIEQYESYFSDSEASTIKSLKAEISKIENHIQQCEMSAIKSAQAAVNYNNLKSYFPSLEESTLESFIEPLENLKKLYQDLTDSLQLKIEDITKSISFSGVENIEGHKLTLPAIYDRNKKKFDELSKFLSSSDGERKKLQRQACEAFIHKFYNENKKSFIKLIELSESLRSLEAEIEKLKLNGKDKVAAREKVAETFANVLKYMFDTKYTFDKTRFVVQRNEDDMTRGGNRTLSDGEKSVFAFCYYIAQIHAKVKTLEDYNRIYFIVDDPVSSLSYDYIYNITQFLKTFRIVDGDVIPNMITGDRHRMLILTHNDYFFNLACANNLVKKGAFFQLINNGTSHSLSSLKGFVTPHESHLLHVYGISEGQAPVFTSANCIRSVIEGMWKFCHPECQDLASFLEVLRVSHGIEIKSLLINDLSHGGSKYTSPKLSGDITLAAKEAVKVVKKFAPGQIDSLPK